MSESRIKIVDSTIKEFLGLSDAEEQYIRLKFSLVQLFKTMREGQGYTQAQAAKIVGSSQSRIAMMEGGDPNVSVDRAQGVAGTRGR